MFWGIPFPDSLSRIEYLMISGQSVEKNEISGSKVKVKE
jgi:hypothetical protein